MYDLGIIGGMGPEATVDLFRLIVDNTAATKDQDHINVVVLNKATLPDRTSVLLKGEAEELENELVKSVVDLVDFHQCKCIAMPCNTAHFYYDKLNSVSKNRIINMIENTLRYLHLKFGEGHKVWICGTLGTVKSKIYDMYNNFGMEICYPPEDLCIEIHDIISNMKNTSDVSKKELSLTLKNIFGKMRNYMTSSDSIVLACTELSLLNKDVLAEYNIVDALDLLALLAIPLSGGQLIQNNLSYDYGIIDKIVNEIQNKF